MIIVVKYLSLNVMTFPWKNISSLIDNFFCDQLDMDSMFDFSIQINPEHSVSVYVSMHEWGRMWGELWERRHNWATRPRWHEAVTTDIFAFLLPWVSSIPSQFKWNIHLASEQEASKDNLGEKITEKATHTLTPQEQSIEDGSWWINAIASWLPMKWF